MVGTVGMAVAIMIPSPQAKTVSNALRNKGRVINIDPFDIGFLERQRYVEYKNRDLVIGNLDYLYVRVLCRLRHVDAVHPLYARAPGPGLARVRMVQLARLSRWVDREFPLWRIRGSCLRPHIQFSASQVGAALEEQQRRNEMRRLLN